MSVMMSTTNPEAQARMADTRPLPKQGHNCLFFPRPSEIRAGMVSVPALVMKADEENRRLDLLLFYDADDFRLLRAIPRKVGDDHGWDYVDGSPLMMVPPDVAALAQDLTAPGHIVRMPGDPMAALDAFKAELAQVLLGENAKPDQSLQDQITALGGRLKALEDWAAEPATDPAPAPAKRKRKSR